MEGQTRGDRTSNDESSAAAAQAGPERDETSKKLDGRSTPSHAASGPK